MKVILISCGKAKLDHPAPARELYTGSLFRAARGYAEASGRPWWIVSALHGLVDPAKDLDPYEYTMAQHLDPIPWGFRVLHGLVESDPLVWRRYLRRERGLYIELHAGAAYAEPLREAARRFDRRHVSQRPGGIRITEPLAGLQIGERLRWYAQARKEPTP